MNPELRNTALLLSYDGRGYHGWQRHDGRPTVQGTIEAAIREAFELDVPIAGSGRTDRGAHASGQVASVALPAELDERELAERLNAALPDDIAVEQVRRVPEDFHACDSALGKTYRYVLWVDERPPPERELRVWSVRGPLSVRAMRAALDGLVGEHDFATFATSAGFERSSTVRTLQRATLSASLPEIALTFEADGFLYKMVRNLVRAVVKVGEGRAQPGDIAKLLAARDRQAAPGSAPASGLHLDAVRYDPAVFEP